MPALYPVDNENIRLDADDLGTLAIGLATTHTGTFTLNGATNVAVADTNTTASSVFTFMFKTLGGTDGRKGLANPLMAANYPTLVSRIPGTSFTVVGLAGDTSVYSYAIVG